MTPLLEWRREGSGRESEVGGNKAPGVTCQRERKRTGGSESGERERIYYVMFA